MRRRDFIAVAALAATGSAAATWPRAARAQQAPKPVIGFITSGSFEGFRQLFVAFEQGLGESGYVKDRNVTIDYRSGDGQYDRLPGLAAELAGLRVAAIATSGGSVAALAAKAATSTIPIAFVSGDDPVKTGLVANLNRPEGNITGVHLYTSSLDAKRLGLLHELVPQASVIAALVNPKYSGAAGSIAELEEAAGTLQLRIRVLRASSVEEIDAAFAAIAQERIGGLVIAGDSFFNSRRDQLAALAARDAVPAIYVRRGYAEAGGLMSYGTSLEDGYRQLGQYIGKILGGAKPADLPVIQSSRFELVINLKTAKALGLAVPPTLLARADAVIE